MDKRQNLEWLYRQSRSGAIAWLAAYDKMIARLASNAHTFRKAYESDDLNMDVKEALFKTRRGRVYRALFIIQAKDVFILRMRGPGQAPITDDDIELPS